MDIKSILYCDEILVEDREERCLKKRSRAEENVADNVNGVKREKTGSRLREAKVCSNSGKTCYDQALALLDGRWGRGSEQVGIQILKERAFQKHGYLPAARLLGQIYTRGLFEQPVDLKLARYWLDRAPASSKKRDLYDLGVAHLRSGKWRLEQTGWQLMEESAHLGYGKAQLEWGKRCVWLANADIEPTANRTAAMKWFVEAREKNVDGANAQLELLRARELEQGAGVLFGINTFQEHML